MEISNGYDDTDIDQASILKKASDEIKSSANMDTELLGILEKHIITLQPQKDAVDQAADEIDKLAKERTQT